MMLPAELSHDGLGTAPAVTDWIGGLVVGWFAVIRGGAVAALLTALTTTGATFYGALLAALPDFRSLPVPVVQTSG